MTLEATKEMDRCCVLGWLNEVYRHPTVAFNTYSDEQQIEFAHDALVLLKEQEAETVESIQMDRSDKWGADLTGYCPSCKRPLKNRFNKRFCGECGRPILWEGR